MERGLQKGISIDITRIQMTFKDLLDLPSIYLYAGGMNPHCGRFKCDLPFVGLNMEGADEFHIHHNLLDPMDLPDESVDICQAEDVLEHIDYESLPEVINEIYRVLKKGSLFRLSVPDYRCDILKDRALKNKEGNIIFDSGGGGDYQNGKVINGGHLWFPLYESVRSLLQNTHFNEGYEEGGILDKINFLHYYDENGVGALNDIDYSLGYIQRTPDHDVRVQKPRRPMSIVVDCIK